MSTVTQENPLKVIDISLPQEEIIQDLLVASRDQGFLFIDGHGIPQKDVDNLFQISEKFFTTVPVEEKLQYTINPKTNIGYTHYNSEQLDPRKSKDFKEGYNFGYVNFETGKYNQSYADYYKDSEKTPIANEMDQINPTPPFFNNYQPQLSAIMVKLFAIAREIMRLMTHSLNIPNKNFFLDKMRKNVPSGTTLRMLRYPLIRTDGYEQSITDKNDDSVNIRAGAHTDYGALTLLFQQSGQEGLQLEINNKWQSVPYIDSKHEGMASPLVVNFGDLLNFWTNGLLKSTTHRVKFSPQESRFTDRYSIVFFVHPENDTTLDPVPSEIVQALKKKENEDDGKPLITALQHLQFRLQETYNW
ncbi:hypothetical protein ACO0RG_000791 [Hanseniaspora osmophila]|uniref:UPF0676 protein n=1 Tax=Hanseniaspora osmophila TaxID=56408 RepID=A0A1E5R1Q8_9ASCO|nr:UPF0676 protein [Hanseniaspora osmophila]